MAIQPQIAMGFQMPQFQLPNQGNMLMQVAQLQQMQEANALRQAQARKLQLDEEQENALARLMQSGGEGVTLPQFVGAGGFTRGTRAFELSQAQRGAQQKETAGRQLTTAQTIAALRGDLSDEALGYASQMLAQQGQRDPFIAELMLTPREDRQLLASRLMNAVPGMDAARLATQKAELGIGETEAKIQKLGAETRALGQPKPPAAVQEAEWYRTATPEQRKAFDDARAAGRSVTTIVNPQESAFQRELGAVKGKQIETGLTAAQDAVSILDVLGTGRNLLDSGLITGFGANFLVNAGQALKQAGIDLAADASANTQAYSAALAANVGRIIKLFGAGTGLSNADREYAEKMAGGNITLDERALRRILDINERAARNTIKTHNQNVDKFKAGDELKVPEPAARTNKLAPRDQQALDWARSNPSDPRSAEIMRRLGVQ